LINEVVCRDKISLNEGWKFLEVPQNSTCNPSDFNRDYTDIQCYGLSQTDASNVKECFEKCCNHSWCDLWQWCSNSSCGALNTCWIGIVSACDSGRPGWQSSARALPNPPSSSCNVPYCKPDYNDSMWSTVNVPHDFLIDGQFDKDEEESHGYLPKSQGWYRLHLTIPLLYEGKSHWIEFEGVYRASMVWINGVFLGTHSSGYTSFVYSLTDVPGINYGKDNVIIVYCDTVTDEGWWYEGGGIYRHVWYHVANPVHIIPWGVYAPTYVTGPIYNTGSGLMSRSAIIRFETDIFNSYSSNDADVHVESILQNFEGSKVVGKVSTNLTLAVHESSKVEQSTVVSNVTLWGPDQPYLYKVITNIYIIENKNYILTDTISTNIGFRKVVFDPNFGLILNEQRVKIKGVCNHQDFAGVGTAVHERINRFRVLKLKEMGVNGWRMSHNPPNPELLDLTDELGLIVMDENRHFDKTQESLEDARRLVLRDRNHPSIIMWSVCNEVGCMEGQDEDGADFGGVYKSAMLEIDNTRPFVAAMDWGWGIGLSHVLDAQGINYNYAEYPEYHKSHPTQPIFGSETASCTGARGVYFGNDTLGHRTIYAADQCNQIWMTAMMTNDYVAGGFVWTGFDYKGEPSPYSWPDINSNFGVIDIAGFPKDTFYYYQSWWTTNNSNNVLHLFPHWNWAGRENQNISVWVYSNAYAVELVVNGASLGAQKVPYLGHVEWQVAYKPGYIQAIAYNNKSQEIQRKLISTSGAAASIQLTVETAVPIKSDGADVALVAVDILDNKGLFVGDASVLVHFAIQGEGKIIGVGNGDPSSHEPDKGMSRTTFGGKARVIVQSTKKSGSNGFILTATAAGLNPGKIAIATTN